MLYRISRTAFISIFVAVVFLFTPAIGQLSGGAAGTQTAHALTTVEVDGVTYSLGSDQSWGDYASADAYTGSTHHLVIQDEIQYGGKTYYVREISAEAFADYTTETAITSVTLPDTLWYIEELAFYGAGFQEIVIPEDVKRIENSAFSDCQNLTSITLPSTLFEIGNYCFFNCRNLSKVISHIPSTPAQYSPSLFLGEYIFGCWHNDDDEIVWADPGSIIVYGYGGPLTEDYAKEHGFGPVYLDEPVSEIRMTTSGNLTPRFGQTVTVPVISIASTDEHAKGKLDVDAEWYSSNGNPIPDGTTVKTSTVYLSVTVSSNDVKTFDFSETKLYLNDVELHVIDHDYRSVTTKYGDIETGAYKIQLEAVGKGNSSGKISKDNSNYSSELTMFAAQGSNVTIYAQANAGSEFIEWRKDDPNTGTVAGTNTTLTVPASNSTYYAIFGKALPASGNLGDNAKYTYDSATGTVTISPVGWTEGQEGISMSVTETPFIGTQKIRRVIIENGIGILSAGLFIDEDKIQRVDLPATLRSAGTGDASLDSRYQSAFARCRLVGTGFVVDADNPYLKAINGSLFNKDATAMYTYFGRTGVTEYTVPDTVEAMAWTCFEDFELDKLTLQGNGLRLQDYAINKGTVGQLQINEGVVDLGYSGDLEGHVSVTLPASLEKIGSQNGIVNASSLKNIDVASGSTHFKGIDGVLYKIKDDGKLALYKYPVGKEDKNFTTPANATEIMDLAIRHVKALKNVTLSGDMTTVRYHAFTLRNDLTLTVENPGCAFETLCIDNPSFNVTLRAAEGSLAHEFYTAHYQDNTRWSFEATETSDTPLQRPKNFHWDGDTLSWAAVTGANSYKVDVYTKDAKGNVSRVNYDSITVSEPSFTYELTGNNRYWYIRQEGIKLMYHPRSV
ncbi:MAG: leucine-rich repeat protein [Bacillota bacterium]|nr:leucine-rich repeat protein [Bacillota bacterium]